VATPMENPIVTQLAAQLVAQLRESQAETNRRLAELAAAQKTTNDWLARIAKLLEDQQRSGPGLPQRPTTVRESGGPVNGPQPGHQQQPGWR
jgi:hypothetical protein